MAVAPLPAARADAALDAAIERALTFAGQHLTQTDATLAPGSYPHYTAPDGTWVTSAANYWTSGYLPGAQWLMYEATRDAKWLMMARARQAAIAGQASNGTTQDIGLMIGASFGNDARLTGDANAKQVVSQAATTLATRYNAAVGAIRSWDVAAAQPGDFYLIVDGLMNLELLRDAVAYGGDPSFATIATRDALTTRTHHLRADGSTFHIVIFDAATGAVRRKTYGPGYSVNSTWSRGQSWAIYGFAEAYEGSPDAQLLEGAQRAADYWLRRIPADGVPYWDFDAPGIPNEPRDSSAAAIAAAGLLRLAGLPVPAERAAAYRAGAERILQSLTSTAYLAEGTANAALLQHGTSYKAQGLTDRGLIYGDYYFLEAMVRYRGVPPPPPPTPPPPPPPAPSPPPPAGYAATVLADAPAAYWRLGETAGTVAVAAAGTLNGSYLGNPLLGRPGALRGDPNLAVSLNGTSSYIAVPDAAKLDTGDVVTLELWVKRAKIGTSQGLLSKGTGAYQLYMTALNEVALHKAGNGAIARSSVRLTDTTAFHHIAVTKNAAATRIYLDGVDRTSAATNRTLVNTATGLAIGTGAGPFSGVVDEVAIYPRALSAAAVQQHYAAGTG